MRLSSTVSGRFPRFRLDSDAFWNSHPGIPRKGPKPRRILDHPGAPPRTFAPQVGVLALAGAPPRTFALRGSGALRAAHLGAPVCIQKCAGAGQARFPGNPAVLFPEVPPLVPPWRPSLPGVAHKGGNKETPRGTQRRNQALVCDNVLRKSGPCVRNREQWAKRRPHSYDNKPVGRSARGAAHRSAEPGPGTPNRLGGGRPARGGGAVPDPGRTSRAGPQPAGRQARPMSPRPSA